MGMGDKSNILFLIDYGLCKKYLCQQGKMHIPYKDNKNLTGTARYASTNSHLGIELSRRDDLESIVYSVIYFLKGGLPWQGIREKNKYLRYSIIMERKISISPELLCEGLPSIY